MTENNIHNLATQLTQEQKSAWRIEKHYAEEAGSEEEKDFWDRLLIEKKEHIKALQDLLRRAL